MTMRIYIAYGLLVGLAATDAFASDSIYRCVVGGRVVLTDRPVEAESCESIAMAASNTFIAPPARITPAQPKAERGRADDNSIAVEQLKAKQRCERLEQRLDVIADKMRGGYTVKQGEKLRAQKEQLEAMRRIERCR